MAGGRFDMNVGKVRPGTYINLNSTRKTLIATSTRGVVLIPLAAADYGPAKEFITLTATAPDAAAAKLGYSIYEDDKNKNTLLIREAFKRASTVILYICAENTAAASVTGGGLTATAKYKGTRGNELTYSVIADPAGGFDVEIHLAGEKVETFAKVSTAADLAGSEYITFAATENEELSAVSGVKLSGGTNVENASNDDVTAFLEAAEAIRWNCMAFPFTDADLQTALKAKITYMRDHIGKYVQAAAPNFAADYEGIISVTNGYCLDGVDVDAVHATAFVAAATAGASNVQSNTYLAVEGATKVHEPKSHEEAEEAIKNGELFFIITDAGEIVIEYDINSLVTFADGKDATYRKNRVIRVFDTFAEALQQEFPPNKFNNDKDGWDIVEGIGRTVLKQFGPTAEGGVGAIKNVDYGNDFLVDRTKSVDDQTYITIGLQPVDSAEKIYITVGTR